MPPKKKAAASAAKKTAKPKTTRATKKKSKKEDDDSDYNPSQEELSPSPVQDIASAQTEVQSVQADQPSDLQKPDDTSTDAINPSDDTSVTPENNTDENNTNVNSGTDRVNRDRYRIFVTRIPFEATSDDIENYFKQFGEVEDAYCPKQPGKSHLNKGFGFISFKNDEVLQTVFNARPHTILGREVVVDKATIRSEQQQTERKRDSSRNKRSLETSDRESNKISRRNSNRHHDNRTHQSSYGSYGGYPNHPGYNQQSNYNSYDHGHYDKPGYSNYNRGYGQSGYHQGHSGYGYGQYANRQSYDRSYSNPPPYERPYESNEYNRSFDPNRSINYVFNGGEKEKRGENYDRHYPEYQNTQYPVQQNYGQSYPNNYENQNYEQSRPTPQANEALEAKRLKNKLFVGRMRNDTTVATMRNYFERFGELIDAYIPRDPKTQKGKGFGFISFHNESSVRAVLQATYKHVIDGREVIVDMADNDQKKNR